MSWTTSTCLGIRGMVAKNPSLVRFSATTRQRKPEQIEMHRRHHAKQAPARNVNFLVHQLQANRMVWPGQSENRNAWIHCLGKDCMYIYIYIHVTILLNCRANFSRGYGVPLWGSHFSAAAFHFSTGFHTSRTNPAWLCLQKPRGCPTVRLAKPDTSSSWRKC